MYYAYRALNVLSVLALLAAAWWSIRLARADAAFRARTPADVARAIELAPEDGEYLATLALQAEYTAQDPTQLLEEVARLNPRSSAPRIRLALAAEIRGDNNLAERWLQDAYSVDHQFETRWTLANFYFRQGRLDEFWTWMRSALEMSYGDRVPAFDLCWQVTDDGQTILDRGIPDRHDVAASYLAYLLSRHKQGAIAGAANKLLRMRTTADSALLYAATDQLLNAGQSREAADTWQALGNPRPAGITHPDFAEPRAATSFGHGFDWRFAEISGVTHQMLDIPAAHRLRFSGQQPESCELLRQVVGGLRSGAMYTLHWAARTQGLASPTGITWRIARSTAEIAASEDWTSGTMTFTADSDHVLLVLAYGRPSGHVRAEGSLDLRQVLTSSPE